MNNKRENPKRATLLLSVLLAGPVHAAIGEPHFNESYPISYVYSILPPTSLDSPESAQSAMYARSRRWESGRVLRVCLFDGNKTVARLIREVASEWNKYSAVKFDFGPTPSGFNCLDNGGFYQIRINFDNSGFWSLIKERTASDWLTRWRPP